MDLAKVAFEVAGLLMGLDEDQRGDALDRVSVLLDGFDEEIPVPESKPRKEKKPTKSAPKATKESSAYEPMAQRILGVLKRNQDGMAPKDIAAAIGVTTQGSMFKGATRPLLDSKRISATGTTLSRKFFPKEGA